MNDISGGTALASDAVDERLRVWRESLLAALSRILLVAGFVASTWVLPETWANRNPGFWVILGGNVFLAIVALAPLRFEWRANLFVGAICVYISLVCSFAGIPGDIGVLVAFVAVAGVLLLGVKRAALALGILLVGLLFWVVSLRLGWVERPLLSVTDVGDVSVAARVVFDTIWLSIALWSATAYLFRKLTVTLGETAQLVGDLRAQMTAREEEARRREDAERGLFQAQKLETIGQLAGGVAHDVNNGLTVAVMSAEIILTSTSIDQIRELAGDIRDACTSASLLTRQLLAIGRKDVPSLEVVNVRNVLDGMPLLLRTAAAKGVELHVDVPPNVPPVQVDVAQMRQVLLNLTINARDAMPKGGELHIEVDYGAESPVYASVTAPSAPADPVRIHVRDTGVGIAGDVLPHIFEPFFTTKGEGKGTGLGLSLARAFAETSGGRVGVRSGIGSGTTITLELPRARAAAEGAAAQRAVEGSRKVLVVDDDPRVREVITSILQGAGHRVVSAESGEAALEIISDPAATIDLLCADAVMPGIGGEEVIRRLRELRPETAILICSAYVQEASLRSWIQEDHIPVLRKPFSPADLLAAMHSALEGRSIMASA